MNGSTTTTPREIEKTVLVQEKGHLRILSGSVPFTLPERLTEERRGAGPIHWQVNLWAKGSWYVRLAEEYSLPCADFAPDIRECEPYCSPVGIVACKATLKRRQPLLPIIVPLGMSEGFVTNTGKIAQYRAFLKRGRLKCLEPKLAAVVEAARQFLMPPARAIRQRDALVVD
jgi:hypothetical protein